MDGSIELGVLWDRVRARRRVILWIVTVAMVGTGLLAWLLPPWYRAEATLLPPSEEISFGVGNLLKGIGIPGVRVPTQATPAEVFLAILESERASREIVERFDLRQRYRRRLMVDAIKDLRHHARFTVDDVGIIRVSVEDRDPARAAEMTNAYVEVLDRVNREVRMTKGRRTRVFVGGRLEDARLQLVQAEERLADYQAKNKVAALSPEVSTALETAARLYANRAALEVRLGVVRGYTREMSGEEWQLLQQLQQIDRQLAVLPGAGVELVRLLRDVKALEQLFVLLTAQYEDARLVEARDVATVEQLDVATPPERKSRPKRALMLATALVLSLAAGVGYALLRGEPEAAGARAAP